MGTIVTTVMPPESPWITSDIAGSSWPPQPHPAYLVVSGPNLGWIYKSASWCEGASILYLQPENVITSKTLS